MLLLTAIASTAQEVKRTFECFHDLYVCIYSQQNLLKFGSMEVVWGTPRVCQDRRTVETLLLQHIFAMLHVCRLSLQAFEAPTNLVG